MRQKHPLSEPWKKRLALGILLLLAVLSVLVFWKIGVPMVTLASDPEKFRLWLAERRTSGRFLYMAMVFLQVIVAVIPGEPLEIAGGYAFGALEGTLLCLASATVGSILIFFLVRRFGVRLVTLFFSQEKLHSVRFLQYSPRRTFLYLIVFMIPGTPKDLLCYFAGLTEIRFPAFLLICSLGRLPSIVTSAVGGDALGTKSYFFAVVVFILTFAISGLGLLCYQRICKKHAVSVHNQEAED